MSEPITGLVVLRADELAAVVRAAVADALSEHEPAAAPTLLDREGCARLLGISVGTLDRLRREGLPELKVGDAPRYEAEEVLAWLRGRAR
ncbi:MAG: helix-turn-helix domain-containing protein [Polyangiaceae bacterium]|nr:helix-turn-helix domain-containing protein [Polyangiaceae bacterium]MCL4754358.1 hypothetical protein [Myxococcales bacterium]